MRLVACPSCHIQYDVSDILAESIPCRCGESIDSRPHEPVERIGHSILVYQIDP